MTIVFISGEAESEADAFITDPDAADAAAADDDVLFLRCYAKAPRASSFEGKEAFGGNGNARVHNWSDAVIKMLFDGNGTGDKGGAENFAALKSVADKISVDIKIRENAQAVDGDVSKAK